ncbi:MAG TPA: hypothetical protein VD994_04570 [Prosthecobacter sp.]|nr:hypothetical protein [Prosthecobacter sp.]
MRLVWSWVQLSAVFAVAAFGLAIFATTLPCDMCGLGPALYVIAAVMLWWVYPILAAVVLASIAGVRFLRRRSLTPKD